jgi:hypothetical protein
VQLRNPAADAARLSARLLARLPLPQILHLAAVRALPGRRPNEEHYRQLAQPKPAGGRSWPAGHWGNVLAVYAWGGEVGWPGGGEQAVADMWGVTRKPTAQRWLAAARRRAGV